MEIRFTASVVEAIECVLRLERGWLTYYPKGSDPSNPDNSITVPKPQWCNFSLFNFNRIESTPVKMVGRIEHAAGERGSWRLERRVKFFYWGHHVATVELVGQKIDGAFYKLDNGAFWGVTKVGYFQEFIGGREPAKDWKEIEFEVTRMHGHNMAV